MSARSRGFRLAVTLAGTGAGLTVLVQIVLSKDIGLLDITPPLWLRIVITLFGVLCASLAVVLPMKQQRSYERALSDVVYIETLTGEQQLSEPDEVSVYLKAFELLRAASLTDRMPWSSFSESPPS